MSGSKEKKFDLTIVHDEFRTCYVNNEGLEMDSYIRAYTEFNKFFGLLGTVFGFVGSDVTSKLEILSKFRDGPEKDNYTSVRAMIEFEKKSDLLSDSNSGCRTLLRLHRALIFVALFLEEIVGVKSEDKLVSLCQSSYKSTLAKFHPWVIQKAALLAMHTLPTKQGLLNKIKTEDETEEFYVGLLPKTVEAMKEVYNITQKMYEEHNILHLP